jgi:hypothetical protein
LIPNPGIFTIGFIGRAKSICGVGIMKNMDKDDLILELAAIERAPSR